MEDRIRIAAGTLLQVYADIDLLALELCSDRLPFAPSAEARRALMTQIEEEVVHFSIQERTLETIGMPFTPTLALDKRNVIKMWFSHLDWYEFLGGLQLGIEGIGISVVEKVATAAGPIFQESLRIPISDERRQASFGVLEWRGLLSRLNTQEKAKQREGLLNIFERIYLMTEEALPVPFEQYWNDLGLEKDDLWETVRDRTRKILHQIGLEPDLPASFVA